MIESLHITRLGFDGICKPEHVEILDSDVLTDGITGEQYRGPNRHAADALSLAAKQRICDAINAETGGAVKAKARDDAKRADIAATKAAEAQRIADEAARAEAEAEAEVQRIADEQAETAVQPKLKG